MIRKITGLLLTAGILFVAFLLLQKCESTGGGKSPLAMESLRPEPLSDPISPKSL